MSSFTIADRTTQLLVAHKETILAHWLEQVFVDGRIHTQRPNRDELAAFGRLLTEAVLAACSGSLRGQSDTVLFEPIQKILDELSTRWEQRGFTAFETATLLSLLKEAWLLQITTDYIAAADMDRLREETLAVTRLMDTLGLMSFDSLVKRREQLIARQGRELLEVSTPVVQLWEEITAVPLIGTLDSQRTQLVMERLLQRIVETGSRVAILDITGVPTIDTQTARHLVETVTAVRLLGAQVIVTGIRPEIAQTMVHLGVDLSDVTCRASMAAGLRLALETLGLEVVRRAKAPNGQA